MITTRKSHVAAAAVAVALAAALLFASQGNAQKPDASRPTPTPAPTATLASKPQPTPTPTPTCPLPADYGVKKTVSPEKPLEAVCHNGMILCLPRSAAQAHIQHGDRDLGPCSKQGNNGPCPP